MPPFAAGLRRVLTAALVILPPLAGTDPCTLGALAGRADLTCGMERTATACHTAAAPAACAHCATAAPAPGPGTDRGPTCCDLRPQAEGAGGQPVLVPPPPVAHPAAASVVATPVVAASPLGVASDDGRALPADLPPPLSPRAPPLG